MSISVASPPELPRVRRPLAALVRAALALEAHAPGEITVVLARDPELRELNRRYRSLDRATDVLTFVYAVRRGRRVDGDIAISLDRVVEQARRYRVSRGRELARLAVHGALHLAGLDHHRTAERLHMRRREARALRESSEAVAALDRALGAVDRRGIAGSHSRP